MGGKPRIWRIDLEKICVAFVSYIIDVITADTTHPGSYEAASWRAVVNYNVAGNMKANL
jgi:hypothetical protein